MLDVLEAITNRLDFIVGVVIIGVFSFIYLELARLIVIWFAIILIFAIITTVRPRIWQWVSLYVLEFLSLLSGPIFYSHGIEKDDLGLLCAAYVVVFLSIYMALLTSILWWVAGRKKRKLQEA